MNVTKEEFEDIKSKAEAGDPLYMTDLGMLYCKGWGTSIDESKALYWTQKAVEGKDPMGYHNMGTFYKDGFVVEQDYEKALYYFHLAGEMGKGRSYNDIGTMYEHGEGVEKNYRKAAEYYQKAIDTDKNPLAFKNLAYLYKEGLGVEKNELESFTLCLDGAEAGDEECVRYTNESVYYFYCKGMAYYFGLKDYPKNEKLGDKYIRQTFRLNFPLSLNFLAKQAIRKKDFIQADWLFTRGGNSIRPVDYVEAVQRAICSYNMSSESETRHGAARNEPDEVCCYALLYIFGYYHDNASNTTSTNDMKEAISKMERTALHGYNYSFFWVGFCYENGIGFEKSVDKAIEAYKNVISMRPTDIIWTNDKNGTIIYASACRLAKLYLSLGLNDKAEEILVKSEAILHYDEAAVIMAKVKGKDYMDENDINNLRKAACCGNAEANFLMAESFAIHGSKEQEQYYLNAIKYGDINAISKIVKSYDNTQADETSKINDAHNKGIEKSEETNLASSSKGTPMETSENGSFFKKIRRILGI